MAEKLISWQLRVDKTNRGILFECCTHTPCLPPDPLLLWAFKSFPLLFPTPEGCDLLPPQLSCEARAPTLQSIIHLLPISAFWMGCLLAAFLPALWLPSWVAMRRAEQVQLCPILPPWQAPGPDPRDTLLLAQSPAKPLFGALCTGKAITGKQQRTEKHQSTLLFLPPYPSHVCCTRVFLACLTVYFQREAEGVV